MHRRGKGWSWVADAGRDAATGRRRQKTKGGFATREAAEAAEAALREFLHTRESGGLTEHTSATVAEYLAQWLANQEPTARRTTFRGYSQDLERVVRCVGSVRLQELTPMQLETAYAEMLRSGSARGGPLSAKAVHSLDGSTIAAVRRHRARQVEDRLLVGEDWDDANDLVFTQADGTPVHPDRWTRAFKRPPRRAAIERVGAQNDANPAADRPDVYWVYFRRPWALGALIVASSVAFEAVESRKPSPRPSDRQLGLLPQGLAPW